MHKFKRVLHVSFLVITLSVIFVIRPASTAHAEVHVSGDITTDTVWDELGSPYVLDTNVFVRPGVKLTVGPGTRISTNLYKKLFIDGGTLLIEGTREKPVLVTISMLAIVNHGLASIKHANIANPNGEIFSDYSKVTISSSTISNTRGKGMSIKNSIVEISGSRFENHSYGIEVYRDDGPTRYTGELTQPSGISWGTSSVRIANTAFLNNRYFALWNGADYIVSAENNWWNSPIGPRLKNIPDMVSGKVDYDPWLSDDPALTPEPKPTPEPCCSNVLFIPGLQGTRLFEGDNRLWEPNRNADAEKLYLDQYGSSTNAAVYSGEPIDVALGIRSVYKDFFGFLTGLKDEKLINDWRPFGYDWRHPVQEVVEGREQRSTTAENLIEVLTASASTSKTGKITVVAHSNGGLVLKYLVKRLVEMGRENLIDTIISVAVPHLGTPEALYGLLHGGNQSIFGGLLLSEATVRELGKNMASAYSLLPSEEYFKNAFWPTLVFASTSIPELNDGSYPNRITSEYGQSAFVNDDSGVRPTPEFKETGKPIKGNKLLAANAQALHAILDAFMWPVSIAKWAIIGLNVPTTKLVAYDLKFICSYKLFSKSCRSAYYPHASTTMAGDGTVVATSAGFNSGTTTALDLESQSQSEGRDLNHSNILESSSTQALIRGIIKNRNNPEMPPGVTIGGQALSKSILELSTHSPVDLHVYDEYGNHTGLKDKPAGLDSNDFIVGAFEENIPGSHMRIQDSGEDGRETYVRLPIAGKYRIEVRGNNFGFFTFMAEKFDGEASLGRDVFETYPVTPLTTATTTIVDGRAEVLQIDVNGDDAADYLAHSGGTGLPGNAKTIEEGNTAAARMSLDSLKRLIEVLLKDDPHKNQILERIDHLGKLSEIGKLKQKELQADSFLNKFDHMKLKGLNEADRQTLLDYIMVLLDEAA